jgi:hypothetical protein
MLRPALRNRRNFKQVPSPVPDWAKSSHHRFIVTCSDPSYLSPIILRSWLAEIILVAGILASSRTAFAPEIV